MRPVHRLATLSAAVILAACSGGGVATTGPGATTAPERTESSLVCDQVVDAATDVEASVGGSEWGAVSAKVNDVITWTNGDGVPHRVELDDGSCKMDGNIPAGGTKGLVFTQAGTFPFHCGVHATMKGTIVIS
jgi:plastocyanin